MSTSNPQVSDLFTYFNGKYKEDIIRKIINSDKEILKANDDGVSGKQFNI
jgi:hypothetical protein